MPMKKLNKSKRAKIISSEYNLKMKINLNQKLIKEKNKYSKSDNIMKLTNSLKTI
jgi:hypothetical protein